MNKQIKIICVCGARPNFVKIAPLLKIFKKDRNFEILLVHTGQHYDDCMSKAFFDDLRIPRPDLNLGVGSSSQSSQTAKIMMSFEPIALKFKPNYVLVVGDVNSAVACALVAVQNDIKVIHVEAGLRSFDRSMPEEINRIIIDAISDLLFVSEPSGIKNLKREGIDSSKIHFVGNVMIDTLLANCKKSRKSRVIDKYNLKPKEYGVVTLHRVGNVDYKSNFLNILQALREISKTMKLVFPVHPRTLANLKQMGLSSYIASINNLNLVEPLGYLDFLCLMNNAAVVLTDSGGIQEETTILRIPCVTLRENTERPVTLESGTNHLVKLNKRDIVATYRKAIVYLEDGSDKKMPSLWDGKSAERIVKVIRNFQNIRRTA